MHLVKMHNKNMSVPHIPPPHTEVALHPCFMHLVNMHNNNMWVPRVPPPYTEVAVNPEAERVFTHAAAQVAARLASGPSLRAPPRQIIVVALVRCAARQSACVLSAIRML